MAGFRKRNGRWQALIRRKGKAPASRTFNLRTDAEAWARSTEMELEQRGLPSGRRVLKGITVASLVERYRDEVSVKKQGQEMETFVLNAMLRQAFAAKSLRELTTEDLVRFRDERLREISPGGLRRQLTILKHVFTVAIREWDIPLQSNPMDRVRLPPTNPARSRRLMPGERARLLTALKVCRQPGMAPLVELAALTGMRRSELLRLTPADVDLERKLLWVRVSKNGHPRPIPLCPRALVIVARVSTNSDRLFDLSSDAVKKSWQRIVKRAKLNDLHFHDLRPPEIYTAPSGV